MAQGGPRTLDALLEALLDGRLEVVDEGVVSDDPLAFTDRRRYTERLAEAARRSGSTEAVRTGRARVAGHDVVVVAGDFGFLAGTMGVATAERVVRAFDLATERRLPVLALPVSGGTRMQEGALAFVRMASVAAAVRRHRDRGLPSIAYLRDPTTGGVLASYGMLATVVFAEPGALIGLTGPRVIELLEGSRLPEGTQSAERLLAQGILDDVVPLEELAGRVARVLAVTSTPAAPLADAADPLHLPPDARVEPWAAVERSRRTDRPGARELLGLLATEVTALRGDGAGSEDPSCIAALARVAGVPAVLVAHDRPPGQRGARLGAVGYRKARRAFALADELGLPIVTVVDTQGAASSVEAESGGLAREVGRCLSDLSAVRVPTLAFLLGEGAGGGAIAWLLADRVIAAEHSWLAPIAPEGGSAILHRTTARAPEIARAQGIASTDLLRVGVVDAVVADRPARRGGDPEVFTRSIATTAARELATLIARDPDERLAARRRRYRQLGLTPPG